MPTILIIAGAPETSDEIGGLLQDGDGDGDYDLLMCHSQSEARSALEEGAVDAVLLDSGIDGDPVDHLRWIKGPVDDDHVEVIILAPNQDASDIQAAIEHGAYYHVTRPVVATRLQALVRAAIASRELNRTLALRAAETEDCFRLLAAGAFEVRSIREAELLATHLGSACGDPQKGVAILELLVNSIEHGNLGIGYERKSRLLSEGRYQEEIDRLLESDEHSWKCVRVELQRIDDHLEILISDTGPGFDHSRFDSLDADRFFDSHGRGVLLATAMVQPEYLGPGNRVRVRLPLTW